MIAAGCGGWQVLSCKCGGDLCVCGLDGEDCPGCLDCNYGYEDEDESDYCDCVSCSGTGRVEESRCPVCLGAGYLG